MSLVGSRTGSIDCDDGELDVERILDFHDAGNAAGSDREVSLRGVARPVRVFVRGDERRAGARGGCGATLPRASCEVPASDWSHKSRAMLPFGSLTPMAAAPSRTQEATISQSESRARRTALENDARVG